MASTQGPDLAPTLDDPDAHSSGSPRAGWATVTACLADDHRLIDAILARLETFVRKRELTAAAEHFAVFQQRLETHIGVEETVLFPIFELAAGSTGPTSVMRREHAELRNIVRALGATLSPAQASVDQTSLLRELSRLLGSHNQKEERVLYPQLDASVTEAGQRKALLARLEQTFAQPAKRDATP
jgi:iron-sulfur cluster repair protein YtfE (RIC family)